MAIIYIGRQPDKIDTSKVIPFPVTSLSRPQPEKTCPHAISKLLHMSEALVRYLKRPVNETAEFRKKHDYGAPSVANAASAAPPASLRKATG